MQEVEKMNDYQKKTAIVVIIYLILIALVICGLLLLIKYFLGFEIALLFGISLIIATIGYVTVYLVIEGKI